MNPALRFGLGALPIYTGARTRSISPENPTGGKGRGAMADPATDDLPFDFAKDLGKGWKVRPFEKIPPHATITVADISGSGVIQHIWMATQPGFGRQIVLRMYWDGEESPSVECCLADFFAIGHDLFAPVNSLPVVANTAYGLNCYWPMPFGNGARITLTNEGDTEPMLVTYQVTYAETDVSDDLLRFHAQWRRSQTDPDAPDHTILEATGRGHYVGTFLAWTALSAGWFGEGEIKFYIDGDDEYPTICGTGTEDYLGGAWNFPANYSTPFLGVPMRYPSTTGTPATPAGFPPDQGNHPGPQKFSLYRWHVMDPVCFDEDLRVTIQALGWLPSRKFKPLDDDIASVAFWYQSEPHAPFGEFPPLRKRWPR